MKRTRAVYILLALCAVCIMCAAQAESAQNTSVYQIGDALLGVSEGVVVSIERNGRSISLDGLYVDVGVDGAFIQNSVGYQRFWDMSTWTLAKIVPMPRAPFAPESFEIEHTADALTITHDIEGMRVALTYRTLENAIALSARITSNRGYVSEIQGVYFYIKGARVSSDARFRFPGNTPGGEYALADMRAFATRQTDYCNPLTLTRAQNVNFNALFLDTEEKWASAVYSDRDGNMNIGNLAMVEQLMASGDTIDIGTLYLQFAGEDSYAPVRALYGELGYHTPDTDYTSGPMYSCHPAGTMDSGFRDTKTMRAYSESLQALADMGIETIWVLPIFEHTGRGVYEPTDQALIDKRYGADSDVRAYVDAAHALNMRVLFDYVPHGPFPSDALALEHADWQSVHRRGQKQIEWDCVSFDMANPEYQAYTQALIKDHVARFDVDGGRIDCAMGGLTNWQPYAGNRASSSSLKGGRGIVAAIREGFIESGKTPLLLPENFHPVPFYAPITDIFYDMPLYKLMHDMRNSGADEITFANTLISWLESERLASVPGQLKLRFLGNHDTVSWTWDRMRATGVYGEDKAMALWTLMSFIDGVPFIYMGDEDSALYHFKGGYDLTEFFTDLFSARKAHLSDDMDTKYIHTENGVAAFWRVNDDKRVLALINLTRDAAVYALPEGEYEILYGAGDIARGEAALAGYGCLLLRAIN